MPTAPQTSSRTSSQPATSPVAGGFILGAWLGCAVTLFAALLQDHSTTYMLRNLGLTAMPLGVAGMLAGSLVQATAHRPEPVPARLVRARTLSAERVRELINE